MFIRHLVYGVYCNMCSGHWVKASLYSSSSRRVGIGAHAHSELYMYHGSSNMKIAFISVVESLPVERKLDDFSVSWTARSIRTGDSDVSLPE